MNKLSLVLFFITVFGLISCAPRQTTTLPASGNQTETTSSTPAPPTFLPPILPPASNFATDSVDYSIVIVWNPFDGEYTTGVVVGDSSQVLTTWDFERSTPNYFTIVVPGGANYKAMVGAFDSRTAALMLKAENMKLPVATAANLQTLKPDQPAIIRDWNSTTLRKTPVLTTVPVGARFPDALTKGLPNIGPGAVLTDEKGNVLVLLGVDYMGVGPLLYIPHPNPAPTYVYGEYVSIDSALDLLSPEASQHLWENGPLEMDIENSLGGIEGRISDNYETVTGELKKLMGQMGDPLTLAELAEFHPYASWDMDGTYFTFPYAFPVDLRNESGKLLARAKWISIQWGRSNGQPNRVFYAGEFNQLKPQGGFVLKGDVSTLAKALPSD